MSRKTIYDIAKKADVSIATVSRVMNDSSEISDKTREKVLGIADQMGYYPQANAQGLALKRKNRIMILVPIISNYFFIEVLAGIQDEILDKNYELNIFNISSNGEDIYPQVETIIKKQTADGYIFISTHLEDKKLKNLLKYDAPISLIDERCDKVDSVVANGEEGINKAMHYLIDTGHQRIAFICALQSSKPSMQRIESYKKSLQELELPVDESLIRSGDSMGRDGFTEQNGYEAMKKMLKMPQPPDACLCASDIQAIGAMKTMREKKRIIPIIGYDDITIADFIGLSTVRQPMYKMGQYATRELLLRMKNPQKKPVQTTLQSELILRKSTTAKL